MLDGEVVAFGADGRPSFQQLQKRMHVASERQIARLARESPVAYVAFDLLWLEGHSLMERRYEERRAALLGLELRGPTWQVPGHHVGDGDALLAASRAQGLEGIVAKRLDCPYRRGGARTDWVKVKNVRRSVGGDRRLAAGGGRARGRLGALCVGFYEDGGLRYAGRVGTGFTEAELDRARPPARAAGARHDARSPAASRPSRRASSSRGSSPRSSSSSGRRRGRCARRATRACATTSTRATSRGIRARSGPAAAASGPPAGTEQLQVAVGDLLGGQAPARAEPLRPCG